MGKRAASGKGGVVVAQEIRNLVAANNEIKGPEVLAALRAKFPKMTFNDSSCQVAYANARKKLGISKTVAKRPIGARVGARPGRPAAAPVSVSSAAASSGAPVDISLLQAAKALLQHCHGDVTVAQGALKQIASLQMN